MVSQDAFRRAAKLAISNVVNHGDTDIFPFPFENHIFFDNQQAVEDLIVEYNDNYEEYLARFSPRHVSSLTPVSYSGFRWATQLDPIWNLYLLTCALALAPAIERVRIDRTQNIVFSYRYSPDRNTGHLFDRGIGWYQFMDNSLARAKEFEFVVACDISEFYPRLNHHRLEIALKQIAGDTPYPTKIDRFLSNYSNTRSFGLPIGGPAARILSEITINQIDRLLLSSGVIFTRFADDYHLFANSKEDAYQNLLFLSEKLLENQGLSLQKSKTRIMTSAEFAATNPLRKVPIPDADETAALSDDRSQLLRFSLTFDPYSPTAEEDYEKLKSEIQRFDILGLLKAELKKSRVHTALTKKIVSAIRFLSDSVREEAVLSFMKNSEILYPIYSNVLILLDQLYDNLSPETRQSISAEIRELIRAQSHIMRVDVHLGFALRVLAHDHEPENVILLQQLYSQRTSPVIRRDVILILAKWQEWYWLSDLRNRFRELSGPERRAFIVASYKLTGEGGHWRDHIEKELSPFEKLVMRWAGEKAQRPNWVIPI